MSEREGDLTTLEEGPVDPGEVASAGRSCLVILLLAAGLIVLVCAGLAVRWLMTAT